MTISPSDLYQGCADIGVAPLFLPAGYEELTMPLMASKYVKLSLFCVLTGYTEKACRRKMEQGIWVQGIHYRKAPDGNVMMNLKEYEKWVERHAG